MILPDVNLLIYAYDARTARHQAAKAWWKHLMEGSEPVALPWVVLLGFLRITTHRKIFDNPLTAQEACRIVRSWLERPQVSILHPGNRHAEILFGLLGELGTAANLTTDAHLAALAIEFQAELHSADTDFARFSGLRWSNPIDDQ